MEHLSVDFIKASITGKLEKWTNDKVFGDVVRSAFYGGMITNAIKSHVSSLCPNIPLLAAYAFVKEKLLVEETLHLSAQYKDRNVRFMEGLKFMTLLFRVNVLVTI